MEPYYQDDFGTLHNGDSLSLMNEMDDKSVDIVFYDPPYNVKKKYDGYSDNLDPTEYYMWMERIASEAERISKNGIIVYVGGKLRNLFDNIIPNSHMIVVHKRAAGVFSGNYMLQYHLIFSTVKPVIKCKDLWDDVRLPGEGYFFREPRFDHPGLTGLSLTEKVLQHFTKENNIVFDPFVGTGTTALACKKMNRKFIGVDQSKKYLDIGITRISEYSNL